MEFQSKKVIVTGANRSMGQHMAVAFAEQGADVVISYRSDKQGADKTLELLKEQGSNAAAFHADFSEINAVKEFFDQAVAHLGHIDILINNAAMLCRETLFELPPEKMQKVFQVNSIAPLYLTQLCSKDMVENNIKGVIINISSISGTMTGAKGIGYSASKAAMNKWTQNAALNLSEHGVRINTISPGVIEAGMNANTVTTDPELWEHYINGIPLQRTGAPDDITHMALFLASDKTTWITGKIFEVDGGQVL
jgi:glucose 1-dehydrogenase